MDNISLKLYQYLCDEVVGSEKVVKYRRQFFRVYEFVLNKLRSNDKSISSGRCLCSGSKAEGLDLPGSDFDVMFSFEDYPVYEISEINANLTLLNNSHLLIIDNDYAQPGFVLLRTYETDWNEGLCETNEFGTFISSKLFKQSAMVEENIMINGPCITDKLGFCDLALCLECEKWPSFAKHWISRYRSSGWPSELLISTIVMEGVLLVPIGSKSDSEESNPLEWRISFSVPEKILIHSMSHSQILCYALLKLLLKEVVKKVKNVDKLLCSYFLKTTLFWLSEELDQSVWTRNNLLRCFMSCLKRLTYWIIHRYIPNYFIPQHNMIDRKIAGQSRDQLISLLNCLSCMGWRCLLLCDSLSEFFYEGNISNDFSSGYSDLEKAVFPLLQTSCVFQDVRKHDSCFKAYYQVISNNRFPRKTKILCFIFLTRVCSKKASALLCSSFQFSNKRHYYHQKQFLPYCLIATKTCAISEWTLLGFYLYICKRYNVTLTVLEYVSSVCCLNQFIISQLLHIDLNGMNRIASTECKLLSFWHRIKLHTAWDLSVKGNFENQMLPFSDLLLCPSVVFLHYLRFLCYHRLHDIVRREESLWCLLWTVKNVICDHCVYARIVSYRYLWEAFNIVGDKQRAELCRRVIVKMIKSTEFYLKYFNGEL